MSTDAEHLQWIYSRLVAVHGENPQYDYMRRLKEIIEKPILTKESTIAILEKLEAFYFNPDYAVAHFPGEHMYTFTSRRKWMDPRYNRAAYGGFDTLQELAEYLLTLIPEEK